MEFKEQYLNVVNERWGHSSRGRAKLEHMLSGQLISSEPYHTHCPLAKPFLAEHPKLDPLICCAPTHPTPCINFVGISYHSKRSHTRTSAIVCHFHCAIAMALLIVIMHAAAATTVHMLLPLATTVHMLLLLATTVHMLLPLPLFTCCCWYCSISVCCHHCCPLLYMLLPLLLFSV